MNHLANTIPLCSSDVPQMSAIRIGGAADGDVGNLVGKFHFHYYLYVKRYLMRIDSSKVGSVRFTVL